jgi:hypothetical protein
VKKHMSIFLAIILAIGMQTARANADEAFESGIGWYLDIVGYELPEQLLGRLSLEQGTQTFSIGEVKVTLREILYDGFWIYTSASVMPSSPDGVIIMPGSASFGDPVRGGYGETAHSDERTFLEAAQQEGKRLLCVYVYPREFDEMSFYFLDHRQDAGGESVMVAGSCLDAPGGEMTIHWSVQVFEVDKDTGSYTLIDESELPQLIQPLGDVIVQSYKMPDGEALALTGITLIHTALTTYAIPAWADEAAQERYAFSLMDEGLREYAAGPAPAVFSFEMEQLPGKLYVQISDSRSIEGFDPVAFARSDEESGELNGK